LLLAANRRVLAAAAVAAVEAVAAAEAKAAEAKAKEDGKSRAVPGTGGVVGTGDGPEPEVVMAGGDGWEGSSSGGHSNPGWLAAPSAGDASVARRPGDEGRSLADTDTAVAAPSAAGVAAEPPRPKPPRPKPLPVAFGWDAPPPAS
jgi:hypothetical protein